MSQPEQAGLSVEFGAAFASQDIPATSHTWRIPGLAVSAATALTGCQQLSGTPVGNDNKWDWGMVTLCMLVLAALCMVGARRIAILPVRDIPKTATAMRFQSMTRGDSDPTELCLFVRPPTGPTRHLRLDANQSIGTLLQQWAIVFRCQPSAVVVQWRGNIFDERRSLRSYDVKRDDTLHCSIRIRGGGLAATAKNRLRKLLSDAGVAEEALQSRIDRVVAKSGPKKIENATLAGHSVAECWVFLKKAAKDDDYALVEPAEYKKLREQRKAKSKADKKDNAGSKAPPSKAVPPTGGDNNSNKAAGDSRGGEWTQASRMKQRSQAQRADQATKRSDELAKLQDKLFILPDSWLDEDGRSLPVIDRDDVTPQSEGIVLINDLEAARSLIRRSIGINMLQTLTVITLEPITDVSPDDQSEMSYTFGVQGDEGKVHQRICWIYNLSSVKAKRAGVIDIEMTGCDEDQAMIHWTCERKHALSDRPIPGLNGAAKDGKTLWDQVAAAPLETCKATMKGVATDNLRDHFRDLWVSTPVKGLSPDQVKRFSELTWTTRVTLDKAKAKAWPRQSGRHAIFGRLFAEDRERFPVALLKTTLESRMPGKHVWMLKEQHTEWANPTW